TAGSVRMPAAWCGVTGHKPTYGLVPRTGVFPLGWSLDQVGPLAITAEDCALMLSVIAGPDGVDRSVAADESFAFTPIELSLRGLRIGIATDPMEQSITEVQNRVQDAAKILEAQGAVISEVKLPIYQEVNDAAMLSMAAEALAYHRNDA